MDRKTLEQKLAELGEGTKVNVSDLTGTEDHYQAEIQSPAFAGKSMMEQHRLVYAIVSKELTSGEIHALTLKTSF